MKDRKQNPALLIATLGVYLGLVLAGAAPSVLANAALSKQFNVRDEIEFKDDLDTKPDRVCDLTSEEPARSVDARVSSSISKFLAQFQPVGTLGQTSISETETPAANVVERPVRVKISSSEYVTALESVIPITSFPRGSLPSLLADA